MKPVRLRIWALALCGIALGGFLPACALLDPPPKPRADAGRIASDPAPSATREVAAYNAERRAQRNDGAAVMSVPPRPDTGILAKLQLERRGAPPAAVPKGKTAAAALGRDITLTFFEPESLKRIIEVVLGDALKVPFVIDEGFKDKQVRMFFSGHGSTEQLIQTFDALLDVQGVKLKYLDGVYLVSSGDDKSRRAMPSPAAVGIGETTGVVRLSHMESKDFLPIARQLMQVPERAALLPGLNSILLVAAASEIRAVQRLAVELDIPYFEGKTVTVYAPRFLSAKALVTVLDQQQAQLGSTAVAPNRQIEAREVPEQERVVIVTTNDAAYELAMEMIARVDVPSAQSRRQVFQYTLATQKAVEIAATLKALLGQVTKGTSVVIDPVADKDSNSLLIFATPDEYAQVRSLIERIDARPAAVLIDVTIVEVALNDQLQLGVEWFLRNTISGLDTRVSSNFNIGKLANSLEFFLTKNGRFAVLQMLGQVTDFSVLSSPQLLVKNGYTAKMSVGGEEPVIKSKISTTQTQQGSNLPQTEYANVKIGLDLEVTPTVGSNGEVKLTMLLKDVRLAGDKTLSDGTVQPRLTTREVKTEFVTADGSTVFIGGIREQGTQATNARTPLLGDIPALGWLFRNKNESGTSTELIVLATATVITDQTSADRITRAYINARREREARQPVQASADKPAESGRSAPANPEAPARDAEAGGRP